jgi:hypothetical protein
MTRSELEHIIRAAGTIANVEDIIVIGSQAALGEFPHAPSELLVSNEADIFRREHPERTKAITRHGMARRGVLEQSLAATSLDTVIRTLITKRIAADFGDQN